MHYSTRTRTHQQRLRAAALGATVSPLNELLKELPELSASANHPKSKFSMDLPGITDKWLKSAGDIQHVVIFGIESHVCVLQTTLDLLEKGIQVHVIKDGVSSCNVGEIDVALEVSSQCLVLFPLSFVQR